MKIISDRRYKRLMKIQDNLIMDNRNLRFKAKLNEFTMETLDKFHRFERSFLKSVVIKKIYEVEERTRQEMILNFKEQGY